MADGFVLKLCGRRCCYYWCGFSPSGWYTCFNAGQISCI